MVGVYVATERIYLDKFGKVCDSKDKNLAELLCPAGGKIPMARAVELGLVNANGATVPAAEVEPAKAEEASEPVTDVIEDEAEAEAEETAEATDGEKAEEPAAEVEPAKAAKPAKDKAVKPAANKGN